MKKADTSQNKQGTKEEIPQKLLPENCIPVFNECIDQKDPNKLHSVIKLNFNAFKTVFEDVDKYFQIKDWRYYLLGYYILNKEEENKTLAFINLSSQVDKYLKDNYKALKDNYNNEYNRKKNMYKDISIPCSNLTGSTQSIEEMIKTFFFCIYAAYQIIMPFQTKSITSCSAKSKQFKFLKIFEQKICFHPSTVKSFFQKKDVKIDDEKTDDAKYMCDRYKSGANSANIKTYVESIEKTKNEICKLLIEFIESCDKLFFILLCRWYELFLKSIVCIPSTNFVNNELSRFVLRNGSEDSQICEQLYDIIKKDPIYKILSDTSTTSLFIIRTVIKCILEYNEIIKLTVKKSSKSKEEADKNDSIKKIQDSIDNLFIFEYDPNLTFSSENDYEFSPEIVECLCNASSGDYNENKKEKRALKKNEIANMIKTTLSVI